MYVESVRRSSGVLLIALATLLASFVVIAPEAVADQGDYTVWSFTFANGQTYSGDTVGASGGQEKNNVPLGDTGYVIHISCSQQFAEGWNISGGFPTEGDDPAGFEILYFTLMKFHSDGEFKEDCSGSFVSDDGSLTVKKDASDGAEAFQFSSTAGANATVIGDNVDSHTWSGLLPGDYTITELISADQATAGWEFTSVTCDSAFTASGLSATTSIDGNNVTCTFSNTFEEPPPPASAAVLLGTCNTQTGLSSYTVEIDPDGAVMVSVTGPGSYSADYTTSGGDAIEPGTYNWTAVALGDHELTSAVSGSFTAEPCAQDATVTVSVACIDTDSSLSNLTVVISPAGSAEVTIAGQTLTDSGGTIPVDPGTYPWTAESTNALLWNLTATSGTVEAIECDVPDVTVTVVDGECLWNGEFSTATVTFTIDPDGAATIYLTTPGDPFDTSTSGSFPFVSGNYSWTAEGMDGYELKGTSEGTFTVGECPPPASIGDTVWHDVNNNGIQEDGEDGIEGVTVNLISDSTIIDSTMTDANGEYSFTDLPHGDYSIGFVIPDGWNASPQDVGGDDTVDSDGPDTATTTLDPGEEDLTWDMGLYQDATIIVEKIVDPVTDDVFDFTGDITAVLGNGESASASVAPGTYTVTETVPENWALIGLSCTTGGSGDLETGVATYEVLSGDEVTCTYTNTNEGTVIITKETDVDTDDTFEFTVGGETHELAAGEEVVLTLPSGDYDITENILVADAWELIAITCSGEAETDIEARTATVFVPPTGTVGCTFVNSELAEPLGVLGDYVWNDADKDGVQDADEVGLPNVKVELISQEGGLSGIFSSKATFSTTTNDVGIYVFANVPAGDYIVSFTAPTDFEFSPADQGDDALDSDVVSIVGSVGQTATFAFAAGSVDTTVDAGISRIQVENSTTTTVPVTTTTTVATTVTTVATTVTTVGSTPTTVADTEVLAETVEATPEPDTEVLGIQTELPATGFGDRDSALLALALVMAGMGILLLSRKEDDFATISGFAQ